MIIYLLLLELLITNGSLLLIIRKEVSAEVTVQGQVPPSVTSVVENSTYIFNVLQQFFTF